MTVRSALKASTSPFAHLGRPAAAAGDDDKKKEDAKKAKAEGDDEDKKGDETKDDAKKSKKAKAEEGDDEEDDDDEPKKDKAKGKAKKAKADEDDGDDDMEDEEQDPDAKSARARERARIRAILVSEPGKANPVAAAHLATGTSMPRGQAIEMLAAMQAGQPVAAAAVEPKRDNLRDRMADVPNPTVGSDAAAQPAPNLAAQIIAADKKRLGE